MHRLKTIFTVSFVFLCFYSFSQSQKRIQKNLSVIISGVFDSSYTISFDRKNPNKHGWEYVDKNFKEAFVYLHFKLGTPIDTHHYTFIMDYDYGYIISAYKMQYSNLRGEIIDATNPSQPIGTFTYNGRYENDALSDAIALQVSNIIKDQLAHPKLTQNSHPIRSKEDRLTELKNLLDKGLITKEDYETQKAKILNE